MSPGSSVQASHREPSRWHSEPVDAVLARFDAVAEGLSDDEASRRRRTHGLNRLPPPPRVSALAILSQQFSSLVVWLLVTAAGISLLLGDQVEAAAIAAVLAINTAIGFAMEWRARRAMEAVLLLEVPRATVVRSGRVRIVEWDPLESTCRHASLSIL